MSDIGYDEWLSDVYTAIDRGPTTWKRIGIWAFPTNSNHTYSECVVHYCRELWRLTSTRGGTRGVNSFSFHECDYCGKKTPDGIKMIALLEKL